MCVAKVGTNRSELTSSSAVTPSFVKSFSKAALVGAIMISFFPSGKAAVTMFTWVGKTGYNSMTKYINHILMSVSPAVVTRESNVEKSGEARAPAMSGQLVVILPMTSDKGTALAPLMETVATIKHHMFR